jgi:hypothetical protein
MDWQLVSVILIVVVAAGYLAWRSWQSWSGKRSGCTGCSCRASAPAQEGRTGSVTMIPVNQLTLRRRA